MAENWNPDYLAEYKRRIELFDNMHDDPYFLAACKLHYKYNPIDFISDVCVTYDPRVSDPMPRLMPFILFPRQIEFVTFLHQCLNEKQHGLIEKARDVGASYLCVAFTVWLWLFYPETAIGWGSRKEEYVDKKGDTKAIFPKIRQLIEYVPPLLLPKDFNMERDATYMKIINPENGAIISGEAGANQGRGSRNTIYFKDESAHYEQAELIEAALGDNTDVAIDISSVNGTNNVFYRKRMAGEIWYPDVKPTKGKLRVFIFDWSENPLKTQEWYDARRAKAESEGLLHIFAQEVERNYSAAVDRLIIHPDWINAAVDAHKVLKLPVEGSKVAGQDVADEGGDRNALSIRHGWVLRHADHWGGSAGDAARQAVPICVEWGVTELYFDSIGIGAGFKEAINNMMEIVNEKGQPTFPQNLGVYPWNAGAKPLDGDSHIIPGDAQSPTNEDQYANLKAQAWFRVRSRFYKTYRAVKFGERYEAEELISLDSTLPRLQEIKNELSQPQYKNSQNGKVMVDKKPSGAASPNIADSIVMCFCPCREVSIFDCLY